MNDFKGNCRNTQSITEKSNNFVCHLANSIRVHFSMKYGNDYAKTRIYNVQ